MREIKFRAWDKLTQKYWNIENWHFEDEYLDLIEFGVSIADPNIERIWRKLNEVELTQYTGLDDVNGKPIYDGDIVEINTQSRDVGYYSEIDYKCLVTWYRGVFYCDVISYKIVQEEGYVVTVNSIDLADVEEEDIEIIGNQFENPELLEV